MSPSKPARGTSPKFTWQQRAQLVVIPPLVAGAFRGLCRSCAFEVRYAERVERVIQEHGHFLAAIWHETMGVAAYCQRNRGYYTLTSHSFDGELAARACAWFGVPAVRGSSSRGGARALQELEGVLGEAEALGLTLDGPKGPRRVAKPGMAYISAKTGVPMVPQAYVAASAWRLNSWDRTIIPKPFSRIVQAFGEPVPPPAATSREAIDEATLSLQQALNSLHEEIEAELGVPAT